MQSPAVSGSSLKRTIAAHFVLSLVILVASSIPTKANPNPVTINFDTLPAGIVVSNQYPQATFFSPGGWYGSTIYSTNYSGRSYPNSITSQYNSCGVFESGCGRGDVYLDFPIPVNNFSFYILGSVNPYYRVFEIDVYVNGFYYGTYEAPGNGQPNVPIYFDRLRSISNITNLRIRGVSNTDYYYPYNVYYDDFTFTPGFDVNITSGRVGGILNGTTQNAMLGADVALNASIAPSNLTGGTYSWSVTGPNQQVSATNTNSSYTVRWTEPGTYQATVTYSRNGFSATSTVNVNVVIPKLTGFTATQAADRVVANDCGGDLPPPPSVVHTLGCPPSPEGITFSATAQIPSGSYLSDPAQSGIKYVQITSSLWKRITFGSVKCQTARNSESDIGSGWQLDTADPYRTTAGKYPIPRFSEGNILTIQEVDAPRVPLTGPSFMLDADAHYVNDYFEMYVVYFTGANPGSPTLQRVIGFQNSPKPAARLAWSWGGQAVYDPVSPYSYQHQFSAVPPRTYAGEAVDFMRPYSGNTNSLSFVQCPGGPPLSTTKIDSSRFFVNQQYKDILNRPADGSWIYWIRHITLCAFDQTCINNRRIEVVRGFYESSEFQQTHPGFENPGTAAYNEAYVVQLYRTLLLREPDGAYHAWVNYLNQTGDYHGVVGGFINSVEYRNRPDFR